MDCDTSSKTFCENVLDFIGCQLDQSCTECTRKDVTIFQFSAELNKAKYCSKSKPSAKFDNDCKKTAPDDPNQHSGVDVLPVLDPKNADCVSGYNHEYTTYLEKHPAGLLDIPKMCKNFFEGRKASIDWACSAKVCTNETKIALIMVAKRGTKVALATLCKGQPEPKYDWKNLKCEKSSSWVWIIVIVVIVVVVIIAIIIIYCMCCKDSKSSSSSKQSSSRA